MRTYLWLLVVSFVGTIILGIASIRSCGMWDGVDNQGKAIGGQITCAGLPLPYYESPNLAMTLTNSVLSFLLDLAVVYVLFLLIRFGIKRLLRRK